MGASAYHLYQANQAFLDSLERFKHRDQIKQQVYEQAIEEGATAGEAIHASQETEEVLEDKEDIFFKASSNKAFSLSVNSSLS